MPGLVQSECSGLIKGSPLKKNRLSLKFLQKKETKRALDFTVTQDDEGSNEPKGSERKLSKIFQLFMNLFATFMD